MRVWNYGDGLGEHGSKRYLVIMYGSVNFASVDFTANNLSVCLDVS